MILVFVLLIIIIFLSLSIFVLTASNIKLEVKELHISNIENKLKVDFILNIGVFLLNKFKIINYTIDNIKISNLVKMKKIDMKKIINNKAANKDILKEIKKNEFEIEYFKVEGYFATFNIVLSSWIYAIITSSIPIFLGPKIVGKYINDIKFLNINENIVNLKLNCIINLKMVNIINILHYLKKKGGINNGKSSNRRAYAYSNE